MSRSRTGLTTAVCLVAAMIVGAEPASAQVGSSGVEVDGGPRLVVLADPAVAGTFVPPPPVGEALAATASFQPTYSGFTPQAQAAFQRALDIWAGLISSPVPIQVNASYHPLSGTTLGQANANGLLRDFGGAPQAGTYYPLALANALAGRDLTTNKADITAEFSSTSNWYFGLDGHPPAGQYDFLTVVLHEIGHGLGFAGSMSVDGGLGSWGIGTPAYPMAFDRFTTDSSRRSLLNTGTYPNPSSSLAGALQSSAVYFDSPLTNAADGTGRARLYAPGTWSPGSSYSHLSEATYPAGNPNSLMTPSFAQAEAIHSPGPLVLCVFEAIGWSTSEACPPAGPSPPPNDSFANAQSLTGAAGGLTNGTNVFATREAGEPSHAGNAGGTSVWYRWTAPAAGTVRVDTTGSSFDTLLAVYTGSAVSSLSEVASNDDDPSVAPQSGVSFAATSGQVYRFAVDGFNGASGAVALHWALNGGGTGTITVNVTSADPGDSFTVSGSGVASANSAYELKLGSSAETCSASPLRLGSSVTSSASGNIATVQRILPVNSTTGVRWLCWVSTADNSNHTLSARITVF